MLLVGAGLGHGVDHAARGLPQLSAVVAGGDLVFLDGIHAIDVGAAIGAAARLGEERLVVVGAVHGVRVVKAGDAAIGHQAAGAIGSDIGGEQYEAVPAPAGDGQVANGGFADHLRLFGLLGVHNLRHAADGHLLLRCLHDEGEIHAERLADLQGQVLVQHRAEAGFGGADFVLSRLQERRLVDAGVVGLGFAFDAGAGIAQRDGSARYDRTRRIGHNAGNGSRAGALRPRALGHRHHEGQHQYAGQNPCVHKSDLVEHRVFLTLSVCRNGNRGKPNPVFCRVGKPRENAGAHRAAICEAVRHTYFHSQPPRPILNTTQHSTLLISNP